MNRITHAIEFDYSPAYELLVSLYTYLYPGRGRDFGTSWTKEVRNSLTPELSKMLGDQRLEVIHRLAILVWQCPTKSSAKSFLKWLESLSTGEIIERMIPWVHEFKENMRSVRNRIIDLLYQWNEAYFERIDPHLMTRLRDVALHQSAVTDAMGNSNATEIVERLTNGIYLEPAEDSYHIILTPQFHLSPFTMLDFYDGGLVVCQYPVSHGPLEGTKHELMRVSSALADPHRLGILEFVSEGPRSYKDIAAFTNLGKSLVTYHLSMLRGAGLLRVHYRNGRPKEYSIRRERFLGFTQDLLGHFNLN